MARSSSAWWAVNSRSNTPLTATSNQSSPTIQATQEPEAAYKSHADTIIRTTTSPPDGTPSMDPQNQERLLAELLDRDGQPDDAEPPEAARTVDISYPKTHVVIEIEPNTDHEIAKPEN